MVWQIISLWVGNAILLVGPLQTLGTLLEKLTEVAFWKACLGSVLRITSGFVLGVILGAGLAVLSHRYAIVEELLSPIMALLKAVPVASFVVLFLIWWSSAYLATVISFCITLPNLYVNTLQGMKCTDKRLLEVSKVFKMAKTDSFLYIYRPALKPFWESAVGVAAGMSWKSGIAAEVIGLPASAIGEQLYLSKIYLDTAGVLAWTVVVILLSVGFERLIKKLGDFFFAWEPACKGIEKVGRNNVGSRDETVTGEFAGFGKCLLEIKKVSKKYYEQVIYDNFSAEYEAGSLYVLDAPSGSGKTTLFRMIASLEQPDSGEIYIYGQRIAYLFQEDRLCEDYSAIKNVEMVTGDAERAARVLKQLLQEEDMYKPCKELSGGMKRRVALARAVAAQADILLLDEPFNGLDEANRERVQQYIIANTKESIVLMASHVK